MLCNTYFRWTHIELYRPQGRGRGQAYANPPYSFTPVSEELSFDS